MEEPQGLKANLALHRLLLFSPLITALQPVALDIAEKPRTCEPSLRYPRLD